MKFVETKLAPAPIGPYSQAVAVGPFLYCSGQIALDPKTGNLLDGDVEAQTELVFSNVKALLADAGSELKKVFKTTIFLKDMADFQKVNTIYAKHFGDHKPARSTVAVAGLPKGALVEIEVIAMI